MPRSQRRKLTPPPVMPAMCGTCPFRKGSPYAYLREYLTESATGTTRICHQTGKSAIQRTSKVKPHACRGTRNFQLALMHTMGVIDAPTDEAWTRKVDEMNATLS